MPSIWPRLAAIRSILSRRSETEAVSLDAAAVARILFGDAALHDDAIRSRVAAGPPVRRRADIRRLLAATERQFTPSPVTVHFGPEDIRAVEAKGFRVIVDTADVSVSAAIARHGEYEPHTSAVMRRLVQPGMTVVDIGANIGWFSLLAATLVGAEGRVIAVEPWSENCRILLLSVAENGFDNVELWPVALDRQRGWAHFMTHTGSNGGLVPDSAEALASGNGSVVPVFPLDELLGADERVDFLKIDVEGAEHRVVLGAQKTLERWRPVVMSEFSLEMIQRVSGTQPGEYLAWFADRGWTINVIDRVDGGLRPFPGADALLAWWPDPLHLEDLLLVPAGGTPGI